MNEDSYVVSLSQRQPLYAPCDPVAQPVEQLTFNQ